MANFLHNYIYLFVFLFQFDGSEKFYIPLPRQGQVVVASRLDYETLATAGRTYYMLNISANVSANAFMFSPFRVLCVFVFEWRKNEINHGF